MMASSNWVMFAPEVQLLLACARPQLNLDQIRHVRTLGDTPLNWNYLFALAQRHRLVPLLARHLPTSNGVPPEVLNRLAAMARAQVQHTLRMTADLVRLIAMFEEAGIATLALKGPTLAQAVYHEPALRSFGDLDLLLSPATMKQAVALLKEAGFRNALNLDDMQERLYVATGYHLPMLHAERGTLVELHFRLSAEHYPIPLEEGPIWERSAPVLIAGRGVRTLAMDDLLIFLCHHGTRHAWDRLIWLCDVAELIRRFPELPRSLVSTPGVHLADPRPLRLALFLANSLLDAPLADNVLEWIGLDGAIPRLAGQVIHHLPDPTEKAMRGWQSHRFRMAALSRWRERGTYLRNIIFERQVADLRAMTLPQPLAFLYPPLRVGRLLIQYGTTARERQRGRQP